MEYQSKEAVSIREEMTRQQVPGNLQAATALNEKIY